VGFVLLDLLFYVYCFVDRFVLSLLVIVLSVRLQFTDSDYPFGIFKHYSQSQMSLQNKHKLNSVNQTSYILEDDVLVSNIAKIGVK